jgi:hypothetical protein
VESIELNSKAGILVESAPACVVVLVLQAVIRVTAASNGSCNFINKTGLFYEDS